jgi:hypothetical protein
MTQNAITLRSNGKIFRVFRAILVASIFIVSAILFVRNAYAQEVLVDRTDVVKSLNETHGESTVGMGLASNGGVLELLTSTDGSTWTIIVTMPDGKSRLVGEGKAWMDAPLKLKGLPI